MMSCQDNRFSQVSQQSRLQVNQWLHSVTLLDCVTIAVELHSFDSADFSNTTVIGYGITGHNSPVFHWQHCSFDHQIHHSSYESSAHYCNSNEE